MSRLVLIGYEFRQSDRVGAATFDPARIGMLRAVDPTVEVVYAPVHHDAAMLARMRSEPRDRLLELTRRFPPAYLDALAEAEVLFTLFAPVDLLDRAPRLRWLANIGSGTDQYQAHGILGSGVALTSAKGVAGRSIAEFAMSQLLVLARRWPERLVDQRKHIWRWHTGRDLDTMTLGIVGLGEIGREAARLAKAFGMRVLATRRTAGPCPAFVDELFSPQRLHEMLGQCDAVLLSLAYTAETAGLFGRSAFEAMRPGSLLLNVARGGIVDEGALVEALSAGRLGGAAFDVFAQEPLPSENPLWDAPNLLVSAHNAVGIADYSEATFQRFVEEFRRYVRGEPLRGAIDPASGY